MSVRIAAALALTLLLAACGRQGAMLRPEPGVTIMKEGDKAAEPAVDKPFVLDKLL
jgi:predicted small lipoprotein YifL